MGQGMCVSSRLPPGEDVESSPEEYKPPLGLKSPTQPHRSSTTKKKLKLKQLPVKVRVFLKSPNRASHGEGRTARADGLGAATTEETRSRTGRPTAADVIPGVVQRLQLTHQRSFEKEDEKCENGIPCDNPKSRQPGSSNTNENGGRPRTRSFSLRTEKKRVVSTSSESEASTAGAAEQAAAAPEPKPSSSASEALSPRTCRSTRTTTKDPNVGLNIIKETTILQDGDEDDAPLAQLDELKQFYSFEGILEIKYTKVTRTRTGDKSPVVPYKYTRTTVTTSRSASPSVSPRTLSPSATPRNVSPQSSRPATPTQSISTQTISDEESYFSATHSTPKNLQVPRSFFYSELDSDSDTVMDTDTGDSSTLSTSDDASVEYARLLSPDDADDDESEEEEEEEEEELRATCQSVADTSFDSLGVSQQYDSARSMSESSSLTSVTMLPSPVSWSVPLREADIVEDILSPTVADEVDTPCTDAPVSKDNIHEAMQELRVDSDNDSGVDHGEGRSDESLVVEEQVSRNTLDELHHEVPIELSATSSDTTEDSEQKATQHRPAVQEEEPSAVPKQATKPKQVKKALPVSLRQHIPPFTSNRIPYTTAASSWPFRIRPASMMFQFNRRYIGRTGQGNALMMLFGPLIYNPNFPWHEALVSLKVPRNVIKDMNAHLAICSAHQKRKKTGVRVLDTRARDPSKEIDGDDNDDDDDEGSDVDGGRNLDALLVVEVQEPQPGAASAAASAASGSAPENHKGKKSKSKDAKSKGASQEHSFTKTPPKKDDAECIIL